MTRFIQICRSHAAIALFGLCAGIASAQSNPAANYTGEFERPYGFAYGQEERAFDANTRDINGNRVIIDGRIVVGDDLSSLTTTGVYGYRFAGSGAGYNKTPGYYGQTNSAVGNQLNVITQGSYNTVVIDSTQINNGDQEVVLNGELNLDD